MTFAHVVISRAGFPRLSGSLVVLSCVVSSPLIPRSLLCIPSSSRPR